MHRQKLSLPFQTLDLLLEELQQMFRYDLHLIADVGDTLEELQQELISLNDLMIEMCADNYESKHIRDMAKEISRILGEGEIAIDTFVVEATVQKKSKGWIPKAFRRAVLRDLKIKIAFFAEEVKLINQENLKNSFEELRYNQANPISTRKPPTQVPKVEEDHVVGFETPAEDVVKLLTRGPEKLEVIAIAGMPGLGKTTLAKMVYKDPKVDYEYVIQAFVYVSRQYDKRDVLLQILTSVSRMNDEVMKMDKEQLEKYVFEELKGRQYLIVLDDVWELEDWDAFKGAFPDNNGQRCRVLITTANARLAEYANPMNPKSLYLLDFLSFENSRELLGWKVFGQDNIPDEIEQYVHKIAVKCNGLPLAIVLTAGVLLDRRDRVTWWKQVSSSVYKYMSRDVSDGNIIEMMYEHLPSNLKPCFIYLGVFRGDYEIPVWKLVRLWISEGFIEGGENTNLEDIAEQYLEELVQRNLVMVVQRKLNGKMKTCRLHHTLREFCKKEANEENLFQEVNWNSSSLDNCRRICINDPIMESYVSGAVSGKRVRSFLTFQKEDFLVDSKHVSFIPKTFKLLKVLEAECLILNRLPPDLSHLFLLKYLAVSSHVSSIPSAFSGLWRLQTLIVCTNSLTLKVEMDLWKMPYFRHFHTDAVASLPSPADTKSQNLPETNVRTLSTISTECCNRKILDHTPRLKKLGICGDLAKFFESTGEISKFGELNELESLKLTNADGNSKLYGLPLHTCFPPQLTKLTLTSTRLEWKEMSTLGMMENLETLKLRDFAFQGHLWSTEEGGFNHLVHLFIGNTDLVVWEVGKQHFPVLRSLQLNGCYKLDDFPLGLVDNPSLQSVVLHCVNPRVALSARRFQVLRLAQANRSRDKKYNLKLSIYPPDH